MAPEAAWRGRVVDALKRPIDGGPRLPRAPALSVAPAALSRQRVGMALKTGVRVIDIFTPLCFGQRLGIFAGSGVGKSTLLAMLAAADAFDTVVVALVGERGREVREFLEDTIGHKNMAKTVAVVSTSNESAMMRKRAPGTAMRIAEHFRDRGDRVLLVLDSITRFAHALREVATGSGEHPVARGYPASVFTDLPKLLERAGPGAAGKGSITAVISVLIDGDDHNDPVADSVRGILDGHIVLDRAIAEQGRYPPVNPLSSISRLATKAWSDDERTLVTRLKSMIARYEDTRDIRLLGAYQAGVDAELSRGATGAADLRSATAQIRRRAIRSATWRATSRARRAEWRSSGAVRARSRTRSTASRAARAGASPASQGGAAGPRREHGEAIDYCRAGDTRCCARCFPARVLQSESSAFAP